MCLSAELTRKAISAVIVLMLFTVWGLFPPFLAQTLLSHQDSRDVSATGLNRFFESTLLGEEPLRPIRVM